MSAGAEYPPISLAVVTAAVAVETARALAAEARVTGYIDPTLPAYGAVPDGVQRLTGQISPGGNVLTDLAGFSAGDVGKTLAMQSAGPTTQYTSGAITSGTRTLSIATSGFTGPGFQPGIDGGISEGIIIEIAGAGPAGGVLRTTITQIPNDFTVTLADAASTTVSGATVTYAQSLQATITAVGATTATLSASAGTGWAGGALTLLKYDYGTDNTTAINNALAAGPVYLRPGRWCHTGQILVSSSTMSGAGRGRTVLVGLVSDAAGTIAINLSGTNAHLSDLTTQNPYFTVRNTAFGKLGVFINAASQWSVIRVDVDGAAGQGIKGVSTTSLPLQRGVIFACDVANTLADGIAFSGQIGSQDIAFNRIIACNTRNTGDDAYAIGSQVSMAGTAHHNVIAACTHEGQRFGSPGGGFSLFGGYANTIIDCLSQNATLGAVRIVCAQPQWRSTSCSITSGQATLTTSAPFTQTYTADGTVTSGNTQILSATGKFSALNVGQKVTVGGGNVPAGTYIASVQNPYKATLSAAATGNSTLGDIVLIVLVDSATVPSNPSMVQVFGAGAAGGLLTATVLTVTDSQHFTLDTNASTTVAAGFVHAGLKNSAQRFGNQSNRDITINNVTGVNSLQNVGGTGQTIQSDFAVSAYSSQQVAENITFSNCKSISPQGYFFRTVQTVVGDVTADQVITGLYIRDFTGRSNQANTVLPLAAPEGMRFVAGRNIHVTGGRLKDTFGGAVLTDTNKISGVFEVSGVDLVDINRVGTTGSTTAAIRVNTQSAGVTPRLAGNAHSNPAGTTGGTKYVIGYVVDAQIAGVQQRDNGSSVTGQVVYNAAGTSIGRWLVPTGTTSTIVMTLNKLYAVPVDLIDPAILVGLLCEITAAATGGTAPKLRLGIYSNSQMNSLLGIPSSLLLDAGVIDATILFSTTPGKITGLSLPQAPGKIWLAAAFQEGTSGTPTGLTTRSMAGSLPGVPNVASASNTTTNTSSAGWVESGTTTTGALPSTFPAGGSPGVVPRVLVAA